MRLIRQNRLMKVFISWSGSISHEVALALRDWLPSVLQVVDPYVSSEDIDKGARWSTDISRELEESSFGVLCVVPDNLTAPWLNFEAGALSKSFEKGRVSPFLFGLKRADVPPGPLLQFQSTVFEKADVFKLVQSINQACGDDALEPARLNESLEVWWGHLEDRLRPLLDKTGAVPSADASGTPTRGPDEVLAEILDLVREQQRLITSPEELLPPGYVEAVLRRQTKDGVEPGAIRAVERAWSQLIDVVLNATAPLTQAELVTRLEQVEDPLVHILRRLGRRRPRVTLQRFYGTLLDDAGNDEE